MNSHIKKTLLVLQCLAILLLSQLVNAQTSAFAGGQCVAINGMYVSLKRGQESLLGNFTKETQLLEFSKANGINYFILYDLEGMASDAQRQTQLANFISRAKNSYGIQEIAAALGAASSADEVAAYNDSHAYDERIDVLNLEYEFWNHTNRAQAFSDTLSMLAHFETVAASHNLQTEIYIGWINASEGAALADAVDRVLVHYYRQNDVNILQYGLDRLEYLASGNTSVKIAPIFSNEGPTNTGDPTAYFMGPWLETHSIDQPFKTWITEYQQLTDTWKQKLDVMGSTWFLYNYFADIPYPNTHHITDQPQPQQACLGDNVVLEIDSSAVNKDIGWFQNGQCLIDSANLQGSGTDTLQIANLGANHFGQYQARVVSYDSGNPSSHLSTSATITEDQSCSSVQNLALGKVASASSYIAAGYEPGRITDGDTTSSRWASAYSGDQWVQVDLGESVNISGLTLTWDPAYAIDYQILYSSDGSNWQLLVDVTDNQQLINNHTGLSQVARFVRILGTEKALPQWGFSLYELEVFASLASGACSPDL
ncbi:discoidin domain-containing protein [Gilvimarinus algae]|uniref:Discoidin domain-containing protein n=1 Tax=Gilvimarinus algae TaxID=3058037 RepID=A0ABT8TC47_9GAMM|nr:discoidin domain-containing protein [Gilvimarinus sp. SDUM040014]MDO3381677.1 discoidin domain-containing protein [Gilvimarinus sp. SDUM040014]